MKSTMERHLPPKKVVGFKTFGGLIDLHLADMKAVGKQIGRSKAFSMVQLKKMLGKIEFGRLDRERIAPSQGIADIEIGDELCAEVPLLGTGQGPVVLTVPGDCQIDRQLLPDPGP